MKINLTKPFTTSDVAKLLASKDDSQPRQLRVTSAGVAYLSDIVGNTAISDLAFRLETWDVGNSYTGQTAATDSKFIARIENALRSNWPNPSNTYIEFF